MIGPDRAINYIREKIVDPIFYPDISQAREVSGKLLEAAWRREPGVTVKIQQRWRNQVVEQELRINIANSQTWYVNLAQSMQSYASRRDRAGIERAMDLLSKQGAILN